MALSVSSWFKVQLESTGVQPVRKFWVNSTDYTTRVLKWPRISRVANEYRATTINISLANNDGALNTFYVTTYNMLADCSLQLGFTTDSGTTEMATLYRGKLQSVRYPKEGTIELKVRDRLWDFTQKKIGDTNSYMIDIGSTLPSDLAWTLCTCYGGMSTVASTSNPDIDYASFLEWAAQFSQDNLRVAAHYEGEKITDALEAIARMTESAIWVDGGNKIRFCRFIEPSSLDTVFTRSKTKNLAIDVEKQRVINTQYVFFNYSVASDYWTDVVVDVRSTSVTSWGACEDIVQDESVWFVDSATALNLAQRRTDRFQFPPAIYKIDTALYGLEREIGETIRLVNSFYQVNSMGGFRIMGMDYDMDTGGLTFTLDEAAVGGGGGGYSSYYGGAFYLDYSDLDGNDMLL